MPFTWINSASSSQSSQTSVQEIGAELISSAVSVTQGSWNGGSPGNLSNAVDGNSLTRTDFGSTYGGGNEGNISIDLGQTHNNVMTFVKFAIKTGPSYSSADGEFSIDYSLDNASWYKLWQFKLPVTSTEKVITQTFLIKQLRYLAFRAKDIGAGQVALAVDDVSMRKLL